MVEALTIGLGRPGRLYPRKLSVTQTICPMVVALCPTRKSHHIMRSKAVRPRLRRRHVMSDAICCGRRTQEAWRLIGEDMRPTIEGLRKKSRIDDHRLPMPRQREAPPARTPCPAGHADARVDPGAGSSTVGRYRSTRTKTPPAGPAGFAGNARNGSPISCQTWGDLRVPCLGRAEAGSMT
jgi:hypothetical protein